MLVRIMIYRHPHHCLSQNIPHSGFLRICPMRTILSLDFLVPKRISVLHDYSSMGFPISSHKSIECQMITQSSILSSQAKHITTCLSLLLIPRGFFLQCTHSYHKGMYVGFLPRNFRVSSKKETSSQAPS